MFLSRAAFLVYFSEMSLNCRRIVSSSLGVMRTPLTQITHHSSMCFRLRHILGASWSIKPSATKATKPLPAEVGVLCSEISCAQRRRLGGYIISAVGYLGAWCGA